MKIKEEDIILMGQHTDYPDRIYCIHKVGDTLHMAVAKKAWRIDENDDINIYDKFSSKICDTIEELKDITVEQLNVHVVNIWESATKRG